MDVLVNWLGQGGAVALAAAAVLRVIPGSRTHARCCLLWAACVLVVALPAVPYLLPATSAVAADNGSISPVLLGSMPLAWWTSPTLVLGFWIIWVGAYAARLAAAAKALGATKRQCRECPSGVQTRLHCWSRVRMTGRRTRVVLSSQVRFAAVLGYGSPIIALSPALLDRLSDADLDRIVIHEWAHVQRYDDVAQFVQRLVYVGVGWHPAVWWLGRQLALEREVACDEIAVAATGSAKGYATCLATLAALPIAPAGSLGLAAVSSSGLRRRIIRILAAPQVAAAAPWRPITLCASLALAAVTLAVGNVRVVGSPFPALSLSAVARPAMTQPIATHVSATSSAVAQAASAEATARRRFGSDQNVRPAKREHDHLLDVVTPRAMVAPLTSAVAAVPLQSLDWQAVPTSTLDALTLDVPPLSETNSAVHASDRPPPADDNARAPWTAAADAGIAIARRSQNAGIATARNVSRFGKKITGSF